MTVVSVRATSGRADTTAAVTKTRAMTETMATSAPAAAGALRAKAVRPACAHASAQTRIATGATSATAAACDLAAPSRAERRATAARTSNRSSGSSSIDATATPSPTTAAIGASTARSPNATAPAGAPLLRAALTASAIATPPAPTMAPADENNGRASHPLTKNRSLARRSVPFDVDLLEGGAFRLKRVDHRPEFGRVACEVFGLPRILFEVIELILPATEVDELHTGRRPVQDAPAHVGVRPFGHVEIHVSFFEGIAGLPGQVGHEGLAGQLTGIGLRHSHEIEQRRHQVDHASLKGDVMTREPRDVKHERHAHQRLPDFEAMLERNPVLVHRLPVVAGHRHDRILAPRLLPHVVQQPSDRLVGKPYLAVVSGPHPPSRRFCGVG